MTAPSPEPSIEPSPSPEAVVPIESPAPEASPSPEASPNAPTGVLPEFVRDLLNSGRNSEGGDRDTNKPRRLESNELRREQEYRNEMARAEEANRADALRGVAGIPVGTRERSVLEALGEPTERNPDGYWNNTRTAIYNVVPDQVTLGYIYDKESERIRQTEASFAQSVDPEVMQTTLDGMLDGKLNSEIEAGLRSVQERQTNQFSFQRGNLEGLIQRNERDRVYIAVWEKDLH